MPSRAPRSRSVQGKHPNVTDGAGHARLDGVTQDHGAVAATDVAALRAELRPRWDVIREAPWLEREPDHTFVPLREGLNVGASILSETLHTVVVSPWVVRARIDGFLFERSKAFLLPAAVETPVGLRSPINELRRWCDQHRLSVGLVVGHTDKTGDPWYNDPLSLERAESFVAYLRQDVGAWLAWFGPDRSDEKRWGPREDRMMFEAIARSRGLPLTADGVRAYQTQRGLGIDGSIGAETRRALVEDYLGLQDTSLVIIPDELVDHGCGESFPRTVKPDEGGVDGQPVPGDDDIQRRVEVFLFDRGLGVQPPPPGEISAAGTREYPEWVRRAQHTHELTVEQAFTIALRLCDPSLEVIPFARVCLDDPITHMEADENGILEVSFRRGQRTRRVAWGPKLEPELRYSTDCYVEFEDDDEGLQRKLHNLGYTHDRPVEAFQREFSRPVTGNPNDVRGDVHAWHDHGPVPAQSTPSPAFGPPGASPSQTGPGRATLAPPGVAALVVGILIGGQPPKSIDDLTVTLTATGAARVGKVRTTSATAVPNSAGDARFEELTGGTFKLVVHVERAHAGGLFVGHEEQTIEVVGHATQDATNVRIPLVTVRNENDTGPPHPVLEKGKSRKVFARIATNDPRNPSWSGVGGVAVIGSSTVNPATISGATPSSSMGGSTVAATQTTTQQTPRATKALLITFDSRTGRHQLPLTVAELESVSCRVDPTPPLSTRSWFTRTVVDHPVTRDFDRPNFLDSGEMLFVLRGSARDLHLAPNVVPTGTPVAWKVVRNPNDHPSLGAGTPALVGTSTTARLTPNATGSFFVSARLDMPASEAPTARGMVIVMAEIRNPRNLRATAHPGAPSARNAHLASGGGSQHGSSWAGQCEHDSHGGERRRDRVDGRPHRTVGHRRQPEQRSGSARLGE